MEGTTTSTGDLPTPNIYAKTDVNIVQTNKYKVLTFKVPAQLNTPFQGCPLLRAGNIVLGIAVAPRLTWPYYGHAYIDIGWSIAVSQKFPTSTTYIKSNSDGVIAHQATTTYVDNVVALI